MIQINRVALVTIATYLILGLFHDTACRAQSKSERVKQLRSQSCAQDIGKTAARISYLEQLQANIGQVLKQVKILSPQASFINQAKNTDAVLKNLLTALTNHNRTKQSICEQLSPIPDSPSGGYKGFSRSERVRLIRTDYCTDDQQNGESIRQEIPALKSAMKKLLSFNPSDDALKEPIRLIQDQWSQMVPIVDDQYDEQMLAGELCTAIEQQVSKSERIRINRQGRKSGELAPFFLNLITIN